ncbi:MAG TPA: FAD-dependent oxidoreductase [Caulobacteraceae bacterium]|nr:FAD-dependent oxidoreductase [Caulobacteraceae bacterium]
MRQLFAAEPPRRDQDPAPLRGRKVLVCGGGIAGPTTAWWLARAGAEVVLLEAAPRPRSGGYMIDFWGPGLEVARRMGLRETLETRGYHIESLKLVDRDGRPLASLGPEAVGAAMPGDLVSLLRGDLAATLMASLDAEVEVLFGERAAELGQDEAGVAVRFEGGGTRRFDYVVGADGLHSRTRAMLFNQEATAIRPLGYFTAAFAIEDYPQRDPGAYVSRTTPRRQIARYALRDGRTAIFLIFAADLAGDAPHTTPEQQKALLHEVFAGVGWEAEAILAGLDAAEDLYFDTVDQVRLAHWWKGRVALVGDAAYCPSLLAGEGASMAMAGAYVLAGELAAAPDRPHAAFNAYQKRLQSFLERKQDGARRLGGWFAPKTRLGLLFRDQMTRLASVPGLTKPLAGALLPEPMTLPDYEFMQPYRDAAR